jgi:hypothetical protein
LPERLRRTGREKNPVIEVASVETAVAGGVNYLTSGRVTGMKPNDFRL